MLPSYRDLIQSGNHHHRHYIYGVTLMHITQRRPGYEIESNQATKNIHGYGIHCSLSFIGTLAHRLKSDVATILLAVGVTFRAATSNQLEICVEKTGCEIVLAEKEKAKASTGKAEAYLKLHQLEDADSILVGLPKMEKSQVLMKQMSGHSQQRATENSIEELVVQKKAEMKRQQAHLMNDGS